MIPSCPFVWQAYPQRKIIQTGGSVSRQAFRMCCPNRISQSGNASFRWSRRHTGLLSVDKNRDTKDDQKLAENIGKAVFASKGGSYVPKVIVVDDDIDPSNLSQLVWAIATRHHPDTRVTIPNQYIFPLVAYLSAKEKADAVSTRVIYNCLTPFHSWPEETRPGEGARGRSPPPVLSPQGSGGTASDSWSSPMW